jgi:hypothetical protein
MTKVISAARIEELIETLISESEAENETEMMQSAFDGEAPSICVDCGTYYGYLEPDAKFVDCCESCEDGGTVFSCLVLKGYI